MTTIRKHLKTYYLLYLGLIIHLLFYISVAWTGWFDIFFSAVALHMGAKGIDFYQLPRGAWAFWHGGSLTGNPLPNGAQYAQHYFSNSNVYHPLFTLTLGSFLALFDPAQSPYVWLWTKLFVSLLVIAYFFWSFRTSKHISFAIFILLANFSVYLELAAWQFHFVLNMLLLLFSIALVKKSSAISSGFLYWLSMLVKPIGLLFVPILIFKGRWRIALLGICLFVLFTAAFFFHDAGQYYTGNLLTNLSFSGTMGPNQIITFLAFARYITHLPDLVYQTIQNGILLLIVLLSMLRKVQITKAVFVYIVYYLCFYEQVYEYQWSTLAYVLAMCVVTCPEFQTRSAKGWILLTCLPSCFILLNFLHIDVKNLGYLGFIPGVKAWEWMVVSKLIPLFLLLASVPLIDTKVTFEQLKRFWHTMRRFNNLVKVFGDEEL